MLTSLLRRNVSSSIVACVFIFAEIYLPSHCLEMNVYSGSLIPAFRRHVTIWLKRFLPSGLILSRINPVHTLKLCIVRMSFKFVCFEFVTMVVMKSFVFWNITPCSVLKVNWRLGWSNLLSFQAWKIIQERIYHKARSKKRVPPKSLLTFTGPQAVISIEILIFKMISPIYSDISQADFSLQIRVYQLQPRHNCYCVIFHYMIIS
jgi:hypothetical protein